MKKSGRPTPDMTGLKFTRLLALRRDDEYKKGVKWICKCDCGNVVSVKGHNLRSGNTKSCGCLNQQRRHERAMKKHPRWKGGRITVEGYTYVKTPGHHRATKEGYVCEHYLVMEKFLGRLLKDDEFVYHKNRVRNDNRIKNLELRNKHIRKKEDASSKKNGT